MARRGANVGPFFVCRLSCAAVLLILNACAAAAPTPRPTLPPTRVDPSALTQRALSEVLSELDNAFDQSRQMLGSFAALEAVREQNSAQCNARASELLRLSPMYAQLAAANRRSILFCNTWTDARQISVSHRRDVQHALATRGFAVGTLIDNSRETSEPALGLAYPVLDAKGDPQGVVMAMLKMNWLARRLADVSLPPAGEIVLMDSGGLVLLRVPDPQAWRGEQIGDTPLGYALLRHRQGSGAYAGVDGKRRFYTFASPPLSNGNLIAAVGTQE